MAVVKVAASTANCTSLPPTSAATSGAAPISRWRKIFSRTTTELSIKREKARANPARTMVLIEPPPARMQIKAASAERGMDKRTANVARTLPRNKRIINAVRTRPMPPSFMRFLMADLTNSDWSKTTAVLSEAGMSTRFLMAAFMPLTMVMVLLSPPLLEYGNIHRPLPIDADDVGLDGPRVFRFADIRHHDGGVADRLQRQVVDLFRSRDLAVGVNVVILGTDTNITSRQDEIGFVYRPDHVHQTEVVSLQLERIDIDHDLAVASAKRLGYRGARVHWQSGCEPGTAPDL